MHLYYSDIIGNSDKIKFFDQSKEFSFEFLLKKRNNV